MRHPQRIMRIMMVISGKKGGSSTGSNDFNHINNEEMTKSNSIMYGASAAGVHNKDNLLTGMVGVKAVNIDEKGGKITSTPKGKRPINETSLESEDEERNKHNKTAVFQEVDGNSSNDDND